MHLALKYDFLISAPNGTHGACKALRRNLCPKVMLGKKEQDMFFNHLRWGNRAVLCAMLFSSTYTTLCLPPKIMSEASSTETWEKIFLSEG